MSSHSAGIMIVITVTLFESHGDTGQRRAGEECCLQQIAHFDNAFVSANSCLFEKWQVEAFAVVEPEKGCEGEVVLHSYQ